MKPNYRCFLLRMWQVGDQDFTVRALLEDPSSRDVVGFANVQDLCAHLEEVSHNLVRDPAPKESLQLCKKHG